MDTKIIGGKIARARKAVGMSQARLGQQLFISPQAVGKWERGESMPDITTFNRSTYTAIKTICFDGATMDKLTYAALKGLHVIDLSKVTVMLD